MLNTDLIVTQDAFIGLLHIKRLCCEEVFTCRNMEITQKEWEAWKMNFVKRQSRGLRQRAPMFK